MACPPDRMGLPLPPPPPELAREVIAGRSLKADTQAPKRIPLSVLAYVGFHQSHGPQFDAAKWTSTRSRPASFPQCSGPGYKPPPMHPALGDKTATGKLSLIPAKILHNRIFRTGAVCCSGCRGGPRRGAMSLAVGETHGNDLSRRFTKPEAVQCGLGSVAAVYDRRRRS